ncbi:MAG: aminotransferase class IV [Nitriliruptoraceae bacterium]
MNTPAHPTHPVGTDRATGVPRAIAWMDGRVVPASEATVPLTDDGFLRGDAVFDAVLVRGGRTHLLDAHLARMRRSAQRLGIRLPVLRHIVTDLLAAWGPRDGAIRLIVTRNGTVRGLLEAPTWPPSITLAAIEMSWRTPLTGIKTLSYAANQMAIRAARERDADDALIVDDGLVLELPTGAIMLVRDGVIATPDPSRLPILDSITVEAIADIAEVTFDVLTVDDLRAADEAFVVSATRPVLGVHTIVFDDNEATYPAPGPQTKTLHDAFAAAIDASLDPAS